MPVEYQRAKDCLKTPAAVEWKLELCNSMAHSIESVVFSPDGQKVAIVHSYKWEVDYNIFERFYEHSILDLATQKTIHSTFDVASRDENEEKPVVWWSPDGQKVATSSFNDKTVRVFDVTSKRKEVTFEHEERVYSVVWSQMVRRWPRLPMAGLVASLMWLPRQRK